MESSWASINGVDWLLWPAEGPQEAATVTVSFLVGSFDEPAAELGIARLAAALVQTDAAGNDSAGEPYTLESHVSGTVTTFRLRGTEAGVRQGLRRLHGAVRASRWTDLTQYQARAAATYLPPPVPSSWQRHLLRRWGLTGPALSTWPVFGLETLAPHTVANFLSHHYVTTAAACATNTPALCGAPELLLPSALCLPSPAATPPPDGPTFPSVIRGHTGAPFSLTSMSTWEPAALLAERILESRVRAALLHLNPTGAHVTGFRTAVRGGRLSGLVVVPRQGGERQTGRIVAETLETLRSGGAFAPELLNAAQSVQEDVRSTDRVAGLLWLTERRLHFGTEDTPESIEAALASASLAQVDAALLTAYDSTLVGAAPEVDTLPYPDAALAPLPPAGGRYFVDRVSGASGLRISRDGAWVVRHDEASGLRATEVVVAGVAFDDVVLRVDEHNAYRAIATTTLVDRYGCAVVVDFSRFARARALLTTIDALAADVPTVEVSSMPELHWWPDARPTPPPRRTWRW